MHLEHEFTVPVSVDQAWEVLLDVERLTPCMPGAVLDEARGDEFDGRVKVKVGPITVTYGGTAAFVEKDVDNRKLVLKASGKEAKGSGTAAATITAVLSGNGEQTQVNVATDLSITGRPAQFGPGVMVDVSNRMLGRFTECLAEQITGAVEQAAEEPSAAAAAKAGPFPETSTAVRMLKWAVPVAAGAALLLIGLGLRRRGR